MVVGASLAGMFAAAAFAQCGRNVTVVDRDRLPDGPDPRPGVPQSPQPHILLHRGLLAAESLLPGLREDLLARGAVAFDTGRIPWLTAYGWLPEDRTSYEMVSATRPLLEHLVRTRVAALPGVTVRGGARVVGLRPGTVGWALDTADGAVLEAATVVDAAGRSSRLPRWLAALGLGVPPPVALDASLGYASQLLHIGGANPAPYGLVIAATPEMPTAGLALPVEGDRMFVMAAGYAPHRPPRDDAGFRAFLAGLRDPALADLAGRLTPVGPVAVHRQTGNRRHRYETVRDWPDGLLAVGDALTAFNPIYGQGITVAACQAETIRRSSDPRARPVQTRELQRRIGRAADVPWAIATGEDARQPSSDTRPSVAQRAANVWNAQLTRLMVAGDRHALAAFSDVYHLMAPPWKLIGPTVTARMARSLVRGVGAPSARPAAVAHLTG